jgi:hypothetical protein
LLNFALRVGLLIATSSHHRLLRAASALAVSAFFGEPGTVRAAINRSPVRASGAVHLNRVESNSVR